MQNYFQLLNLPQAYELDAASLQRAYLAAQQKNHPDRQQGKDAAAKMLAVQASMDANQAFSVLKNPLLRAMHLLELQGIRVNGEQDTLPPEPALLMEVMEWREGLEEAKTQESLERLFAQAATQREATLAEISAAFSSGQLPKAAAGCIRLRYLEKFSDEARLRLRAME